MREAMYRAEVGDDGFGEDPSVNRLEEVAAERMGKEKALFVASGTMGNLVAVLTHCGRGDGAILGHQSHTFISEAGATAAFGSVYLCAVPNEPDGTMDLARIEAAIPTPSMIHPPMKLICLENTHNHCGGAVLDAKYMAAVAGLAHGNGLALHLDGARIFNAAIALGVQARELVAAADTVMFCLSKGLSAPVGSLVCGSTQFITEARRTRRMVGGGMRQAGVLAAAGLVALDQMVDRLREDHENAHILAEGIAEIPGLGLDPSRVRTNIVYFDLLRKGMAAPRLADMLKEEGILVLPMGSSQLRVVTHHGIEKKHVEEALRRMRRCMGGRS